MSDLISIDLEDGIAVLRLQRPQALNAMTSALARAIVSGLGDLEADASVKGIVLTGAGERAFCAGVDLEEASTVTPDTVGPWFTGICQIYLAILDMTKPVIAAINGVAAGAGFQMALVSDMRLAADTARLGQPEVNAGIPSIMGAHWMALHLPRAVNQDLSFTGRLMDASEAEAFHLVRSVPSGELLPRAIACARELAAKPPVAWAHTKARFRETALRGFDEALAKAIEGQRATYAAGEPQAIMRAFIEKRATKT